MTNLPFIDSKGALHYAEKKNISQRQAEYLVVMKEKSILCLYDTALKLYRCPKNDEAQISRRPDKIFTISAQIWQNDEPLIEQQKCNIYIIADAEIDNLSLHWCQIDDILINKADFDNTQLAAIKNLFVRTQQP